MLRRRIAGAAPACKGVTMPVATMGPHTAVMGVQFYSSLPARSPERPVDKNLFERGRRIAAGHYCGSCHQKDYRGREQMPRLAGQREDFLLEAMLAYRHNRRPGGDTVMAASLHGIPEADFKTLAHYLSRLK